MLLHEAETLVEDFGEGLLMRVWRLYGSAPYNQMSIMTTSDIRREAPANKMIVSITAIRQACVLRAVVSRRAGTAFRRRPAKNRMTAFRARGNKMKPPDAWFAMAVKPFE
jgi:hypothetical protein